MEALRGGITFSGGRFIPFEDGDIMTFKFAHDVVLRWPGIVPIQIKSGDTLSLNFDQACAGQDSARMSFEFPLLESARE